jgi:threonine dehydrogenase-like Zn-dependent dehydrogenase
LIIPGSAAIPLPESLTPARAVLAANMETALNAVWDASPENGDRIAIVGVGVVGALVGYLCRRIIPDVHVTLVDINPAREQIARALGLSFAMPVPRRKNAIWLSMQALPPAAWPPHSIWRAMKQSCWS